MGYDKLDVPVTNGTLFTTVRDSPGPEAVILHGGPGMGAEMVIGLVEEYDPVFRTALPQQRGLDPSTLEGPRDVETHVADEIAMLDALGWERAWFIGHSWGGHLAMHVAVAHPERVAGLILIEPLGAVPDGGAAALSQVLVDRLTADEREQLDELLRLQAEPEPKPGLMSVVMATLWPSYSPVHGNVVPPGKIRIEDPLPDGEPDTMASVRAHFDAGTLERGLPSLRVPTLFVHGAGSPMPLSATTETAALIPGARVEIIEGVGHFPWIERKGYVRELTEAWRATLPS